MSQPTPYQRQADFTDYQSNNPGQPMTGSDLDNEHNAEKVTLDQILTNMALLQRDDTALANAVVHPDTLNTATLALIAADWVPKGPWVTATDYVAGDVVEEAGTSYVAVSAHTAGTFATDHTAGEWVVMGFGLSTIQTGSSIFAIATGTVSAMVVAMIPTITALTDGMELRVRALGANTSTTPTINVDGLGVKTITRYGNLALKEGDIYGDGHEMILRYNLSNDVVELLNPVGDALQQISTVAKMKTLNLAAGRSVTTQEFHSGRAGGGTYLIKAPQAFDGHADHELANGNIAVLQEPFEFNANQFGAKGDDSTDDYAAIWAAIQKSATTRKPLVLLPGFIYRHETTFTVDASSYANFTIRGATQGIAGGTLKPVDCACFNFDGNLATGNFVFNITVRDIYIDGSAVSTAVTDLINWDNFYRCKMDNVWINNVPVELGVTVTNIVTTGGTCYENLFRRVMAVGSGNTGSGNGFNFAHTLGHILVDQSDAENMFTGIYCAADTRVDFLSPHLERVGTGFNIRPGTIDGNTQINVWGGTCDLGSATTSGVIMSGTYDKNEMINIDGLRFTSNDHVTKKQAFNVGSMVWNNNTKFSLSNIDWSWITAHPLLREAANITPVNPFHGNVLQKHTYSRQLTGLTDNTATDVFKLDGFDSASPYDPVYVKIKAFVSFNGYGRALEESVFVIQDRGALDANVSAKQIIAEVRETDSANYSITTFFITATANADDITFDITSDFNNSIIATMDPYFEVEVIGQATLTEL